MLEHFQKGELEPEDIHHLTSMKSICKSCDGEQKLFVYNSLNTAVQVLFHLEINCLRFPYTPYGYE